MYLIYLATNKINGKKYIGKNKGTCLKRKYEHKRDALVRNSNTHFHNAIRKYGFHCFNWEIIESCQSNQIAISREKFWIRFYDSVQNGYNLTIGGDGPCGYIQSDETQNKKRESNKSPYNASKKVINDLGQIFDSIGLAEKAFSNSKIGEVCLGKRLSAAGRSWKFYQDGVNPPFPPLSRKHRGKSRFRRFSKLNNFNKLYEKLNS